MRERTQRKTDSSDKLKPDTGPEHAARVKAELAIMAEERARREERLNRALSRIAQGHVDAPQPSAKTATTPSKAAMAPTTAALVKRRPQTLPAHRAFFYEDENHAASPPRPALPGLDHLRTLQGPSPLSLPNAGPPSRALVPSLGRSLMKVDLGGGARHDAAGQSSKPLDMNMLTRMLVGAGDASGVPTALGPLAQSRTLARQGDFFPGVSEGEESQIVLDLEQAGTRQRLRRWLAEENRASQVLAILERAPPNFRQALTSVLERLLCGDESDDMEEGFTVLSGETAMVRSRGTSLVVHEAPLVQGVGGGFSNPAVPVLRTSSIVPRTGPSAHRNRPGGSGDCTLRITLSSRGGDGSHLAGLSEITAVEIAPSKRVVTPSSESGRGSPPRGGGEH
jgi:hypothetical protein